MIVRAFNFLDSKGLQLSRAVKLVNLVEQFDSRVMLRCSQSEYNAKSVLSLMSALSHPCLQMELVIDGSDEEDAEKALVGIIDDTLSGIVWK